MCFGRKCLCHRSKPHTASFRLQLDTCLYNFFLLASLHLIRNYLFWKQNQYSSPIVLVFIELSRNSITIEYLQMRSRKEGIWERLEYLLRSVNNLIGLTLCFWRNFVMWQICIFKTKQFAQSPFYEVCLSSGFIYCFP